MRLADGADDILTAKERSKADVLHEIADALGIEVGQVGVKATTTEGLGFAGTKEGMASYAVALLVSKGA